MADDAVLIGPPAAAESYLSMEKIVEACRKTGAEAVHPGYGFLSEREAFPRALGKAGIVFIGPNPGAIAAMGDEDRSPKRPQLKQSLDGAGPSRRHRGRKARAEDRRPDRLPRHDQGVRRWRRQGDADRAFHFRSRRRITGLAKAEAKSSFGDDRVFIEKFIVDPRHIEIQVLGDERGNVVPISASANVRSSAAIRR